MASVFIQKPEVFMKSFLIFSLAALSFFINSCCSPCTTEVDETTQIQNATGETHNLSVCILSDPIAETKVDVTAGNTDSIFLRKNERYWVEGGLRNSGCDP